MSRRPWYPFYVDDWEQDETVKLLNNRERGVYLRLLNQQWREGSLPVDERALAALAGEKLAVFRRVWPKIEHKFTSNGNGRLANPRMAKEVQKADELSEKRSASSRAGGATGRYLYAMLRSDRDEIKIGISRNPEQRRSRLANEMRAEIKLLGYTEANWRSEIEAHEALVEHRISKEWFHDTPKVRQWLRDHSVTEG